MRIGRLPAQDEAVRELLASRARSRRRFLLLGSIATLACGLGVGFVWGRRSAPLAADQVRLAWARALAAGPLEDLVEQFSAYLDVVDRTDGGDESLNRGLRRLVEHALAQDGAAAEKIAKALHRTISYVDAPADLERRLSQLERKGRVRDPRRARPR